MGNDICCSLVRYPSDWSEASPSPCPLAATTASAQTADTVLFSRKNPHGRQGLCCAEQALAIEQGRIVATGTSATMKTLTRGGNAKPMIDLGGRTVHDPA